MTRRLVERRKAWPLWRACPGFRFAQGRHLAHLVWVAQNPVGPPWSTICGSTCAIRRQDFQLRVAPDVICRVCLVLLVQRGNYPESLRVLGVRKPPRDEARAVPLNQAEHVSAHPFGGARLGPPMNGRGRRPDRGDTADVLRSS
jgi:hypothetical protein